MDNDTLPKQNFVKDMPSVANTPIILNFAAGQAPTGINLSQFVAKLSLLGALNLQEGVILMVLSWEPVNRSPSPYNID